MWFRILIRNNNDTVVQSVGDFYISYRVICCYNESERWKHSSAFSLDFYSRRYFYFCWIFWLLLSVNTNNLLVRTSRSLVRISSVRILLVQVSMRNTCWTVAPSSLLICHRTKSRLTSSHFQNIIRARPCFAWQLIAAVIGKERPSWGGQVVGT